MALKSIPFFKGLDLRFDWEAYEKMVEALEAPAFTDFSNVVQKLGPKQMRIILWAGLLHAKPDLELKDTFAIINEYLEEKSMDDFAQVIITALQEASILGKGGGSDPGEAKTVQ